MLVHKVRMTGLSLLHGTIRDDGCNAQNPPAPRYFWEFTGAHCRSTRRCDPVKDDLEVVHGDELDEALAILNNATINEVATFSPGGSLRSERISSARVLDTSMRARQVQSRTIFQTSIRNDPGTKDYVEWLNATGVEVRTVPYLPGRMIISDRKTAILPLDPGDGMNGLLIVRNPSIVGMLQAQFEAAWGMANPLGKCSPRYSSALSEDERAILELWALGKDDDDVAKALGVSGRTTSRKVTALMRKLDANTRFEAAINAVKNGWLSV